MNTASAERWTQILTGITPDYFKWKDKLDNGPDIIVDISRKGRYWRVTLQDSHQSAEWTPVWIDPGAVDERVNWTSEQLLHWSGVRRMAYDMWYFQHKRDAEKFQTLYNLKWGSA